MICDPVFCTPRDSAESLKNDSDKSHIPLFYHENTDELTKCAMIPVEDPEGVQAIESLKILQKTFDMMEYAYLALAQYPKGEKYALVVDIKRCMDTILEREIEAQKKYHKKTTLQSLDIELMKLRAYIRLSHRLKFLPPKKYEVWSGYLVEIGKMLGGWIKSQSEKPVK